MVFPKRMTSTEEKQAEQGGDEVFAPYLRYSHEDRMSPNKAIGKAAEHCGYGRHEIADLREGRAS